MIATTDNMMHFHVYLSVVDICTLWLLHFFLCSVVIDLMVVVVYLCALSSLLSDRHSRALVIHLVVFLFVVATLHSR